MLTEEQLKAIEQEGNVLVLASAGTGKTAVLVNKLIRDIERNKTYKSIAAMTFTIKATAEIRNRLGNLSYNQYIGTLNTFAVEEIIKPFFKDLYDINKEIEIDVKYDDSIMTANEGVKKIQETGIIGTYEDIRKNFIFQLALHIVKKSKACRLYLQAKYFKLYIDEYQDCDRDTHNFFMYLCYQLKIQLFIVGDPKQSIYIWRGADTKILKELEENPLFIKLRLFKNFRAHESLEAFSFIFDSKYQKSINGISSEKRIYFFFASQSNWPRKIKSYISEDNSVVLRRMRETAKNNVQDLESISKSFFYIEEPTIYQIYSSAKYLLLELAKFLIIPSYSTFEVIDNYIDFNILTKSQLTEIEIRLRNLRELYNEGLDIRNNVEDIGVLLKINIADEDFNKFKNSLSDLYFQDSLIGQEKSFTTRTIHSSKGLEFNQVIIFVQDFNNFYNDDNKNLFYVAITRAKDSIIIIDCTGNFNCLNKLKSLCRQRNVELESFVSIKY